VPEVRAVELIPGRGIRCIDQTRLPRELVTLELGDLDGVCEAIRSLRVRGAPLLGIVGAAGMAMAAERSDASDVALEQAAAALLATRPTAVDLGHAVRRALAAARAAGQSADRRRQALWRFATELLEAQRASDSALAAHGAALLNERGSVLTHCNTGALATGGLGTALAVVRELWQRGFLERCYATETRPLLQGARLTAWELVQEGIPVPLLPDGAAASLLASGRVAAVFVGADRIARNGDTANKIGTYALALAARRHRVPFYVVAPSTTFDPECPDGGAIPIEFRSAEEVLSFQTCRAAPEGAEAYNPAFDVTPAELIDGIVTEHGVLRPPLAAAIERLNDVLTGRAIH